VNIVAGGAAQRFEINTLPLKSRVLPDILPVATTTAFFLGVFVIHGICFCMGRVTVRAVNIRPVVGAADELYSPVTHAFICVTDKTGM